MLDIYVINLKERLDRYKQIKADFETYTNINLIFIDAIKHEKGAIGCFLSHKKCISLAKEQNMPYIIVLEDDCLPGDNFENRLINIVEYLKNNNDWKLFLGGVKKSNRIVYKCNSELEPIYTIKNGYCTHLSIYHHNIYDEVLQVNHIENCVDTYWHSRFLALITLPFLAYQRNGYSDINNTYNNSMISGFQHTENILKKYI